MRLALACLALLTGPLAAQEAWYSGETGRYGHLVLGKDHNWTTLSYRDGKEMASVTLSSSRVFEDTEPRLADLDGDGAPEIIVVEASLTQGAALAVYRPDGETLIRAAITPFIGRANRWLAPAGIADFDGDGSLDIAYVETPHIGGTLRIWTLEEGRLRQVASRYGFSNHQIGDPDIVGGLRVCGAGPELILLDARWGEVVRATLAEGDEIISRTVGPYTGPASLRAALHCARSG